MTHHFKLLYIVVLLQASDGDGTSDTSRTDLENRLRAQQSETEKLKVQLGSVIFYNLSFFAS